MIITSLSCLPILPKSQLSAQISIPHVATPPTPTINNDPHGEL